MDKNTWLSGRALRLHGVILVLVPAFMALCIWQVTRALGGNTLSWAYVFEWPIFAAYAIYMWWRLVHEPDEGTPPASAEHHDGGPAPGTDPGRAARQEKEDADLAAYNRYLAQLAQQDRGAEPDRTAER